jgi:hypothetical protein
MLSITIGRLNGLGIIFIGSLGEGMFEAMTEDKFEDPIDTGGMIC